MNLRAIDLNLLLALDMLLTTSSVTEAAARLGITQPAMSNTLRRLRDHFRDPLFVKHGRSLVPTAWATAVRPALARALQDLEAALASDRPFDPATVDATITIAISDYWQFTLLPRLLGRLEREAPNLRLHVTATSEDVLAEGLPTGAVSAAVFLVPRSFAGLHCETFVTDGYAFIVRKKHPLKGGKLNLADLARFRQVVIAPRGPWSERLAEALHRRGLTFQLALLTAHNHVALDVVSRTDHIAVIPSQIARRACETWPLKILSSPIPLGEFSLGLYWHLGTDKSPLHLWFRQVMLHEAREVYFGSAPKPRRSV